MERSDKYLVSENKQLKDILSTVRESLETISQDSIIIIKKCDNSLDIYDNAYRINQQAHTVTKLIDTYCTLEYEKE